MTAPLQLALSNADRALARLDGAALILPNPELFVYAFMRQEAVLSSQIEGTQSSLDDLFEYEAQPEGVETTADIIEVVHYIEAMNWGLSQLDKLPVCLRLVRGLHALLLREGRGANRMPGEFRVNQNFIGPPKSRIEEATYVPPAVPEMVEALDDWEKFIHESRDLPPLIKAALAHAQFETIHPFMDGNGRLGRMIITFLLCSEKILQRPILYLSLYFKQNRSEYYTRLQAIRDEGDWEEWIRFFLNGVTATSVAALNTAQRILTLRERLSLAAQRDMRSTKAPALSFLLFQHPYITVTRAATLIGATYPTANSVIGEFADHGYLEKLGEVRRGRIYAFRPYLQILREGASDLSGNPAR